AALLFGSAGALFSLVFRTLDIGGKPFRAGGYVGDLIGDLLSAYLYRTGSVVVVLTLLFLAIILSTQFSFGRFFGALGEALRGGATRLFTAFREWREERRREKQRREVIAKHTKKGVVPEIQRPMADGATPA